MFFFFIYWGQNRKKRYMLSKVNSTKFIIHFHIGVTGRCEVLFKNNEDRYAPVASPTEHDAASILLKCQYERPIDRDFDRFKT